MEYFRLTRVFISHSLEYNALIEIKNIENAIVNKFMPSQVAKL